jgi:hypothetical protein
VVAAPPKKLSVLEDADDAFLYARNVIIEAERQIRGIGRGKARLDAVTDALMPHLILPKTQTPRLLVQIFAKTVYTSIAIQLPDSLRMSKTEPPSPPRR